MRSMIVTAVTVLAFSSIAMISSAEQDFDGILSLTPVGEHSCLSISVPVTPGQPIAGLTWIHNDASTAFPKLLIMEGTIGQPPDLTQTSLVLEEITGESLGTGTVTFETPVTSSTDVIDVVFQLPAFTEKTGDGLGGRSWHRLRPRARCSRGLRERRRHRMDEAAPGLLDEGRDGRRPRTRHGSGAVSHGAARLTSVRVVGRTHTP